MSSISHDGVLDVRVKYSYNANTVLSIRLHTRTDENVTNVFVSGESRVLGASYRQPDRPPLTSENLL